MKKQLKLTLIASVIAAFSAGAHQPVNALVDSQGEVVRDSAGYCVETVYNEQRTECGAEEPQPGTKVFTLGAHALFDFDKATLRPKAKVELDVIAQKIHEAKDLGEIKTVDSINVVGHTDSRGSVEYNQRLSERRAESVRGYLVQKGVNPSIISAHGEGELSPVADNSTDAGRQENRRVEIRLNGQKEIRVSK